jgi:hypothetical protein
MTRHLYAVATLGLASVAIPLRAATAPRAGLGAQTAFVWTDDDLEKLHGPGMISIVGRMEEEATATSASASGPYVKSQDPDWYSVEAAKLRDQLERRQAELGGYRQALDDVRSLRETSGGVNLVEGDVGITPQSGIEILQQRINETQAKRDALEDLARRNGIAPGALRVE